MRRTAILAAAIGGLFASSTFAAYTYSTVSTPTANGLLRVDVYALNDGQAVGTAIPAGTTRLQAVEIVNATATGGNFRFRYASGAVDMFNNKGAPIDVLGDGSLIVPNNNSSLYLADAAGDNTYQGLSPSSSSNTWASLPTFSVAYAALGATIAPDATAAANAGKGARFASLVIDPGASFTLTGNVGAEQGTKVPFSVSFGTSTTTNDNPVIASITPNPVNVVFGSIVSNGANFQTTVNATDANVLDVLSLIVGTLPAGVTIDSVVGGGTTPESFLISGKVDYSLNNSTVVVPFTVNDNAGGSTAGSFSIAITPEPASLSLIGLAGLALGRRRK